jgi:hypothetical protein
MKTSQWTMSKSTFWDNWKVDWSDIFFARLTPEVDENPSISSRHVQPLSLNS